MNGLKLIFSVSLVMALLCAPAIADIATYQNKVIADGASLYWSFNSQKESSGYVPEMVGGNTMDDLWPLVPPGEYHPAGFLATNTLNDNVNNLGSAFAANASLHSTYYTPDTSKTGTIASYAIEWWAMRTMNANTYMFSAPLGAGNSAIWNGYGGTGVTTVMGDGGAVANFAPTGIGEWRHFSVIVDATANTTTTILDKDTPVTVAGKLNALNWDGSMVWGANGYGDLGTWQGMIDEFAIYDLTGKSTAQIAALTTSLQGRYDLATYVPEPSSMVTLTVGLIGLLAYAWRKRR